MKKIIKIGASLSLLLALVQSMVLAELWRCKNEDGVTVLDSHLLARHVKNGYTI